MKLHRWMVAAASRIVPRTLRADWLAEWESELSHRESILRRWNRPGRLELARRSGGAFWDALWLQSSHWYSLRLFGRHWRLACTAVVSLGAAIAAMVIGLAFYNAFLLRPPGVANPRALLTVHVRTQADPYGPASFDEYQYYRDQNHVFSDVAAFPNSISTIAFRGGDRREQVVATEVSNNYFAVLGVCPRVGRAAFSDNVDGEMEAIVVSDAFWKKLGADPRIVGTTVRLNEQPVTIIGVTPATFGRMMLIWEPDVWMSFKTAERVIGSPSRLLTDRRERWLQMVGRLRSGVSESQARADVQVLASRIEADHPKTDKGRSAIVTATTVTPASYRARVSLLAGSLLSIVLLMVILACANVTNLLLGLATARRHEMLVRGALGASRLQLVVPMLRESTLLGVVAGAVGYAAAYTTVVRLSAFKPSLGPIFPSPSVDLRPDVVVMASTLGIVIVAGVAVGLAPAWRAASEGVSGALNRERNVGEPRKARLRSVLVVMQMAIATLVMVGVGVSMHSLLNLQHVSLGFSARQLAFIGLDMRRSGYDERTGRQFYARIRQRLGTTPGIEAVSLVDGPPLGNGWGRDYVVAEHDAPTTSGRGAETRYSVVDDRYFSTMGIELLAGRTFDTRDRPDGPEAVVVNVTMARRHWAGRDPVGQRLRIENGNRLVQVIGVVADGKYEDIEEAQLPFMYFALEQHYVPDIVVIARPRPSSALAPDTMARVLLEIEPTIVFGGLGLMTLDQLLAIPLFIPRAIVATVSVFGGLTLVLAIVGLYSTVFYSVSQRRNEIGIRVALGAQPRDLFGLVLRHTARVASVGAALGVAAGSVLLPLVSSLFYGVRPVEPVVIIGVVCASMAMSLITTYVAARPWTRMSALDMLRQ